MYMSRKQIKSRIRKAERALAVLADAVDEHSKPLAVWQSCFGDVKDIFSLLNLMLEHKVEVRG